MFMAAQKPMEVSSLESLDVPFSNDHFIQSTGKHNEYH